VPGPTSDGPAPAVSTTSPFRTSHRFTAPPAPAVISSVRLMPVPLPSSVTRTVSARTVGYGLAATTSRLRWHPMTG